ncbi:MAG: HIT domain-containing protein [Acidimicrobiales bacterium]
MTDCLFCQIVAGDVPSAEVGSNEMAYAFRDIAPAAPSHVLVVPRRHIRTAADLTDEDGPVLMAMIALAQQVSRSEGIDQSGFRLIFNVGPDALNSVDHLHLHVMGGHRMGWPVGRQPPEG